MPSTTLTYGSNSAPAEATSTQQQAPALPAGITGAAINKAISVGFSSTEILDHFLSSGQMTAQIAQARKYGYSDSDILDHIESMSAAPPAAPQPAAPQTTDSLTTAFRNGAGDLISGLGHAGTALDTAIQNNAPAWLSKGLGATGDLQNGGDKAVVDTGAAIHGDEQYKPDPLNSVGNVAHDAAGLIAGSAPSAMAALASGPAAPVILGASGAGNTLSDRMQAKGESSPSASDVAAAAGSGILNAVGGQAALGLGRIPGIGSLGQDAGSAVLRALGKAATSSAAGAAVGAGNYAADIAGTGQMTAQGALSAAGQGAATGLSCRERVVSLAAPPGL